MTKKRTTPVAKLTKKGASSRSEFSRPLILREAAYAELRSRIQGGLVSYGDRIVDYDVADEMGISRGPVRDALLQLVSEGLLEKSSRGFVLPRLSPEAIEQVFELRSLLEPYAVAQSCRLITAGARLDMRNAIRDCKQAHADGDFVAFIAGNTAFRTAWLAGVHNIPLSETISRFGDHIQAVRVLTLRDPTYRADALRLMRKIADAFDDKDPKAAESRVREQLASAVQAFRTKVTASVDEGPDEAA